MCIRDSVNSANGKIDPAPLTITAKNQSKIYGTTFSFAGTEFTTGTLYSNTDTVTSVTLTSSGTPASATVGGSPYSIAPSAAAGTGLTNYIITYVNGSLTVNPAPLTITASSATVTYGATAPIIGSGFSGFVNNEGSTVLTTQPMCVTSYVQGSLVSGSPYPSSCSGAVDGNYTISYVPGTVTVNRAALQITASSAIVTYGATAPIIGSSFSGFVNNEGSTV